MICSANVTFHMPKPYQIYINAVTSGIISLFAIFGNMIIITIFVKFRELRNINNAAITVLSCSDLSRGVIVMTTKVYNQLRFVKSELRPELEEPVCTITAVVCGFTFVFSPMVLAFIALLRYMIISPKNIGREIMSKTKFLFAIAFMFLVAITFATFPLMGIKGMGRYRYSQSHGVCFADWCDNNRTFRTIFYVVVIGIALPVLTIFYLTLFIAFRRHNKEFIKLLDGQNVRGTTTLDVLPPPSSSWVRSYDDCETDLFLTDEERTDGQNERLLADFDEQQGITVVEDSDERALLQNPIYNRISKHESKITRVMLTLFLAYCICWLPAAIVNILAIFDVEQIPVEWFYIIVTMVELKCAVDPLLYGLGNQNYRKAFQYMTGCYC